MYACAPLTFSHSDDSLSLLPQPCGCAYPTPVHIMTPSVLPTSYTCTGDPDPYSKGSSSVQEVLNDGRSTSKTTAQEKNIPIPPFPLSLTPTPLPPPYPPNLRDKSGGGEGTAVSNGLTPALPHCRNTNTHTGSSF